MGTRALQPKLVNDLFCNPSCYIMPSKLLQMAGGLSDAYDGQHQN